MTKINNTKEIVSKIIERRVGVFYPSREDALNRMTTGEKLVFFLGIDPTNPNLHIGHLVPLFLLKNLADLGHKIIILIGDFTGMIGDPTDKNAIRKVLSEEEIKENMATYLNQVNKIIPQNKYSVEYNSKWLKKLDFASVIDLAMNFTVQQMIVRDMFQERIKQEKPIGLHEFLYPLMQGYDSVAMEVDGEIGGNDQIFNMLIGRDLVKKYLKKDKVVLAVKLLTDSVTGKKIGKSEGGLINLNDSPADIFGKTMASTPDGAIKKTFELCTEKDDEWIDSREEAVKKGANPMVFKKELAYEFVRICHGEEEAQLAQKEFERVFSNKESPDDIQELKIFENGETIIEILCRSGLASSKTEAKRLVSDGAVDVNGATVKEWEFLPKKDDTIKVGSHRFLKII